VAEMVDCALEFAPAACCLVPEKREELTTEGGLDVAGQSDRIAILVERLKARGIRVSLFVDPDAGQIEAASYVKADMVELHTGSYCQSGEAAELEQMRAAAKEAHALGLEVHAGHGLNYESLAQIARLPHLAEVNIGHFIIGEAIGVGMAQVIKKMKGMLG